jgi:hypothetical protein
MVPVPDKLPQVKLWDMGQKHLTVKFQGITAKEPFSLSIWLTSTVTRRVGIDFVDS